MRFHLCDEPKRFGSIQVNARILREYRTLNAQSLLHAHDYSQRKENDCKNYFKSREKKL